MDRATPPNHLTTEVPPLTQAEISSIIFGLMVALLLAALDQTIIATALPTIGRELGDLEHLPWVVTSYLLPQPSRRRFTASSAMPMGGELHC